MRFNLKYKLFSSKKKLIDTPKRIGHFKRTKWKARQGCLSSNYRRRVRIFLFPRKSFFRKRKRIFHKSIFRYHRSALRFRGKSKVLSFTPMSLSRKRKIVNRFKGNNNYICTANLIKTSNFRNDKFRKSGKRWQKFKFFYKNSLEQQKSYRQLLDCCLSYGNLKKNFFNSSNMTSYEGFYRSLTQFEFRLDILLYRLRYFRSTSQASLLINSKFIKVNLKCVKGHFLLRCGDIVTFDSQINLLSNLRSIQKSIIFKRFVEIDLYSSTIVVLSSINDIRAFDFLTFIQRPFNLNRFQYSFK